MGVYQWPKRRGSGKKQREERNQEAVLRNKQKHRTYFQKKVYKIELYTCLRHNWYNVSVNSVFSIPKQIHWASAGCYKQRVQSKSSSNSKEHRPRESARLICRCPISLSLPLQMHLQAQCPIEGNTLPRVFPFPFFFFLNQKIYLYSCICGKYEFHYFFPRDPALP